MSSAAGGISHGDVFEMKFPPRQHRVDEQRAPTVLGGLMWERGDSATPHSQDLTLPAVIPLYQVMNFTVVQWEGEKEATKQFVIALERAVSLSAASPPRGVKCQVVGLRDGGAGTQTGSHNGCDR